MTPARAAEMLGRLTAKVAAWEPAIREFNALTREDIALALSMVQIMPARLIARVKYADQEEYAPEAIDAVLNAIERGALEVVVDKIAAPERWRIPRPDFIRDMCRLALAEYLSPRICYRCHGRGYVTRRVTGKRDKCPTCYETGHIVYQAKDRCHILGVAPDAWSKSWKERYSAIQSLFDKYDGLALGGVAKRMSY